ncbi:MAG: hydroxymethylbilane synthase [Burkholderiaceae bacterium]
MPSSQSGPKRLIIATRESRLALWQAEHVRARLVALYPKCDVRIEGMTTRGDQILDRSLAKVGGKGLFVKELETALLEGRCDLAVHSLKDVPMTLPPEFELAAILEREDPRDAFVSGAFQGLGDMPERAVVGTSSLRREAQLRARYPHLQIAPARGNLDTRLSKLDRGDFGAIILAVAGLRRLGFDERIRAVLEPEECLPSPGQGALGIEVRAGRPELREWIAPLHHARTAACVLAERAVSRGLGGSCTMPLGAYATYETGSNPTLQLEALLASPNGARVLRCRAQGDPLWPERLGEEAAGRLIAQGGLEIIDAL